ncbi:proteobacterial dedicated sortase system histidine kinase [Glaciecola sp. MH2013]|uniref:ATP-binding protein n=1 Tax=Glaciecola sp. MH2013 TaxID=2785524 RepID=UPI0018A058DF|nr:ATP-binding protein [Glaciecola sp. MH2013]MBF7075070.1 proteobacterial dedicated sortase system histidine kinase [Glaciecola sp. MH2013]
MRNWRIGLRLKLLFFSSFLFAIPYLGYQYVWELEAYLRIGQEQTMLGTARAVATTLHERPKLFDAQSSFQSSVVTGRDLYAHKVTAPIQLDGQLDDWDDYLTATIEYAQESLLILRQPYSASSLKFTHLLGEYEDYVYAMFKVTDDNLVFRGRNSLRIDRNDFLQISMLNPQGEFKRYIVAPMQEGWVNAYLLKNNIERVIPEKLDTRIQGYWKPSEEGYIIELRFPAGMMQDRIAFAISDVDDEQSRFIKYSIGTANPEQQDELGTLLIPSPEIESILRGLEYANARVWVIDKHKRVLAKSGDIQNADGMQASSASFDLARVDNVLAVNTPNRLRTEYDETQKLAVSAPADTNTHTSEEKRAWWQVIEEEWLIPLYYQILTRPPEEFVDDLEKASALQGQEVDEALQGEASSLWRLSSDSKAVILSAAHPIFIEGEVMGAVVVEQTTNGIRTLRNNALEKQFHFFLAVIVLGTLALFLLASRISTRIRKLRNDTEQAIDKSGKIISGIEASTTQDEIGDLSRTFSTVLGRLSQYNAYLENMASRLSHELRTPVAIVNSSLDNLLLESQATKLAAQDTSHQISPSDKTDGALVYVERAKQGINRLSKILNNMSEATRLEQAIQSSEQETFDVLDVLGGCVEGYRLAYSEHQFDYASSLERAELVGSPELFAQMLDKIVANAAEFSNAGDTIRFSCDGISKDFCIEVSNKGPLLPENMQQELLDSMISVRNTASGSSTSEQVHLGLGLYIAKMIVLFHRGSIKINNLADGSGVVVSLHFKT